ncbi:TonB family C-terminal domain-containing protein [Daejeonella rubra]|uniref:TonB family C-terminal domain-containing protein n=1 Tax=Daejeonella rubra TaxID=990371 RepID=A0A1G9MQU4_9SPHI|nr:energy transducer TonB [Daejeonella rubra]SDL76277.1 TonB family C-terminal domain-containing protein [Daejeonella rubra]
MKIKLLLLFVLLSTSTLAQKVQKNYWKDEIPRKPKGIWEFYDAKGELEQTYDFTGDSLVYQKQVKKSETFKHQVITGSDTILTKLDSFPILIGGPATVGKTFREYLKYPPEAREYRIQGTVWISFLIDDQGKASNYKITKGIGGGCDEMALSTVKSIPDRWIPGMLNGKKVNVIHTIPVLFRLQ